ncbi:iron-siderophore ABC transporter substrate-binding protein [Fodinicola acaciae]|uniref:iron-siderophore ABC transporter substrate-binding protein n=1 Tax=Fodinicola acaciae TaxID=2681555 RepID=UPI0013D234E6|nr:iron-siderophore ABC transporter substrate-binding protein [Fodinicola acaciae]
MAIDRRTVLAGLGGAGLLGLTACGSGQTGGAAADGVRIRHKFGITTVARKPRRVVSLGTTDHDVALELGVTPVSIANFVGTPTGVGPWAERQLGRARPQLYVNGTSDISLEGVAKLRPDLILAVQNDLTKDRYDKLSQLAPVVAAPAGYIDWGVPWDKQARAIATALWQQSRADGLVAGVNDRFSQARKANLAFAGKTVVVASVYSAAAGTYNAYTRQDGRMQFMAALGLKPAPRVDALGTSRFTVPISREKADLMEADLVVIISFDATSAKAVDTDQIFNGLNVARRKAVIRLSLQDEGLAMSCNDVLSIPYALDRLVPKMAAALH